jgi:hypothetical protein
MLDLVTTRLAAGDLKQAASDMATVLQIVESDSQNPSRDYWGHMRGSISRSSNETILAFKLVCRLAAAGEVACERSEAVRLGAQLLRITKPDGIPSIEVAGILAQAAVVLDSEDIDSSLVALVQSCGAKQVPPCLQLVVETRANQGRQQRLYSALTTALGIHVQGGRLPAALSGADILVLAKVLLSGVPGEARPGGGGVYGRLCNNQLVLLMTTIAILLVSVTVHYCSDAFMHRRPAYPDRWSGRPLCRGGACQV